MGWQSTVLSMLFVLGVSVSEIRAAPTIGIGWDRSARALANLQGRPDGQIGVSAFTWWVSEDWTSDHLPLEVLAKVRYARWTLDYDRFNLEFGRSKNLYCLETALTLAGSMWEGGKTVVFLVPALESASEWTLKPKDLKLSVGFLQRFKLGAGKVGLGVAWLRVFGFGQFVPLVEGIWQRSGGTLSARVLVPLEAEIRWKPRHYLSMGIEMRVGGGEYRTDEGQSTPDEWIRQRSMVVGPGITLSYQELFHVTTRGGWTYERHLNRVDQRGDIVRREVEGALFGQVLLSFGQGQSQIAPLETSGWH